MIKKRLIELKYVAFLLSGLLTSNIFYCSNVLASTISLSLNIGDLIARKNNVNFVPPPPPPGRPLMGNASGGAKHSLCESNGRPLRALVPSEMTVPGQVRVWGKMTQDNPMVWFYVPYKSVVYGEFVLRDVQGSDVGDRARQLFKLEISSGIIGYSLPKSITQKLKPGEVYNWSFRIKCNSKGSPDEEVKGWLQWVQPNLDKRLKSTIPLDRVAAYAESGIWYDALAELGKLRYRNTDSEADQVWMELLQQVGLSEISRYQIIKVY